MSPKSSLGQVELEILQKVSELQPISVRDLVERLAESSGQARTTVLTVLERLRKKGYLTRRKINGTYHYSTKQEQEDLMQGLVGDFVQRFLGGSLAPFMAYLQKQEKIDETEVQQLKDLLKDWEEKKGK